MIPHVLLLFQLSGTVESLDLENGGGVKEGHAHHHHENSSCSSTTNSRSSKKDTSFASRVSKVGKAARATCKIKGKSSSSNSHASNSATAGGGAGGGGGVAIDPGNNTSAPNTPAASGSVNNCSLNMNPNGGSGDEGVADLELVEASDEIVKHTQTPPTNLPLNGTQPLASPPSQHDIPSVSMSTVTVTGQDNNNGIAKVFWYFLHDQIILMLLIKIPIFNI